MRRMALSQKRAKEIMNNKGKAGCGCLIGILIIIMVVIGLGFHPLSLKSFAKCLRYEDMVVTADAIFVPRFPEDQNGELYSDAFREYFAGNGRAIYVEDAKTPGTDIGNIVGRMAEARGIKENAVKTIYPGETDKNRSTVIKAKLKAAGLKKVIIVVPEYASRRYHLMYGSSPDTAGTLYMVKPLKVSCFQGDRWWRDDLSRAIMTREVYNSLAYYYALLRKDTTN